MSRVAALGAESEIEGYGLAGALMVVADEPAAVRDGWFGLPPDTALVVLTRPAAQALADVLARPPADGRLTVVMPS